MALLDDTRRWIKDQFVSPEDMAANPGPAIRGLDRAMLELTPEERTRGLEHVKAAAVVYYQGRHAEPIPIEVKRQLNQLERRAERLNEVDAARQVLLKYGGPPNELTIADALDRSQKQQQAKEHFVEGNANTQLVAPSRSRSKQKEMEVSV